MLAPSSRNVPKNTAAPTRFFGLALFFSNHAVLGSLLAVSPSPLG